MERILAVFAHPDDEAFCVGSLANHSDTGDAAGGETQAPNPIELLLAAFAACIEAAFFKFAEHEGLAVEAEVEGTLDLRGLFMIGGVPAGFQEVRYVLRIVSADDESRVRALAEKVLDHCPVVDSLRQPTAVTGAIEISRPEKGACGTASRTWQ